MSLESDFDTFTEDSSDCLVEDLRSLLELCPSFVVSVFFLSCIVLSNTVFHLLFSVHFFMHYACHHHFSSC